MIDDEIKKEMETLREFTSIDILKPELNRIRLKGQKEEIIDFELGVCNHILGIFYKYFQANRFKLERIMLAFSFIAYYFLNELGIKSFGTFKEGDNFIGVIIGDKKYLFSFINSLSLTEVTSEIDSRFNLETISMVETFKDNGDLLKNSGEHRQSIGMYDKALFYDESNCDVLNRKGNELFISGRIEDSLVEFDKAILANPDYINSYINKINSLSILGRYSEIIYVCNQAISLNPRRFLLYYHKGNSLFSLGKYKEAKEMYDIVLKISPGFSEAISKRNMISDLYLDNE